MPSLFVKENQTEQDRKRLAELEEKGYFEANVETAKPVRITREMYHDLETTDLFKVFDLNRYGRNEVMMAHGADDAIVDPNAARMFAEQFHIPIYIIANEGHSLSDHPSTPYNLADLAIAFYEGK